MKYNIEYYEKMLRQNSGSGEMIAKIRWDFISEVRPRRVLDYGSGVGWFRAWRPAGVTVDSYDILPVPQTEIKLAIYDVTCFWDVLEHIQDFGVIAPVIALSKHLAVTVPVRPPGKEYARWKHSKPSEHVNVFTSEGLSDLMSYFGFELMKEEKAECPPRTDIISFLFKGKGIGK
jgi:hypothetical protein